MTTPSPGALKALADAAIDAHTAELVELSEQLIAHPETGFREHRSARLVKEAFDRLSLSSRDELAVTGVKARMKGRTSGITIGILGELDALLSPTSPHADPGTGAAHTCGHNAQVASMIGTGIGLSTVMDALDGDAVLFAVPAEECIEVDWRLGEREAGRLEFIVGKAELARLGEFDDIDIAMLAHTHSSSEGPLAAIGGSNNGSLIKQAVFQGRQSHAGAAPWDGVNAYKALNLALTAIDAQRDTFRDEDHVRVHHLVTRTGDSLTSVPSRAQVEIMVRAARTEALEAVSDAVDRALHAGALALGAAVEIRTTAAYLPLQCDPRLVEVMYENAGELFGADRVERSWGHMSGSTDMGDLGMLMPVVHPFVPAGTTDLPHSASYRVTDHAAASVNAAKLMTHTVIDLLHAGAARGRAVIEQAGPKLTTARYVEMRRSLDRRISF